MIAAGVLAILLGMWAWVRWGAFVGEYRDGADEAWIQSGYPQDGPVWQFVREHTPADATVAYANTSFTYPLFGFDFKRTVEYAPVTRGVRSTRNLPHLPGRLSGEEITAAATNAANSGADELVWRSNLSDLGARFLVVSRNGAVPNPPEIPWADADPATFKKVFFNDVGVVYEITKPLK